MNLSDGLVFVLAANPTRGLGVHIGINTNLFNFKFARIGAPGTES